MTKYEKEAGIPKPSTIKRVDPPVVNHKKAARKRKDYPPCWEVRHSGYSYWLTAHKIRPVIPYYWGLNEKDRPDRKDLKALLEWYAVRQPHTATLPVRFISCTPVECGREIIPN